MDNILQKIVANKRKEVALAKKKLPLSKIKPMLKKSDRDFYAALKGKNNIITEIKYKSPSAGKIGKKKPIKEITQAYDKYASALSVLTDEKFFAGKLKYIKEAKKYTTLPILRKDFMIEEYQIYEARYYGADAVLLIVSILTEKKIEQMLKTTRELGMDALVETKTKEEIEKVLKTSAKIIGINNRNLSNFEISLNTTKELKKLIPSDKIVVSESGIHTKKDILELDTNAVLIGTSLIEAKDIAKKLCEMKRTKVKICGITNLKDALDAINSGADLLGFNFYNKSPRYIEPKIAREIIKQLPNTIQTVGVFVNANEQEIKEIGRIAGIDFIQLHGDENEKFAKNRGANAIKAIRVKNTLPKQTEVLYARIYDSFDSKVFGGSGKTFDSKITSKAKGKIIIAGGLTAENVGKVVNELKPYCVDVASGVEESAGKKSKEKMEAFLREVKKNDN